MLISGGCDSKGAVPFLDCRDKIMCLKRDYKIILHTGLIPPKSVETVRGLADVVSFDFPPSDRAIQEVHGLSVLQKDYIESVSELSKVVRVVPHITVGIRGGKINGEKESLGMLSSMGINSIVINIFTPTVGTKYENMHPPKITEVQSLIKNGRSKFKSLYLGCMRPGGLYRRKLDDMVLPFVDKLVMPGKRLLELNPDAEISYECCAL